jgi:hypothetical protein
VERVVHRLREERGRAMEAVLLSGDPTRGQLARAEAARAEFGRWHGYSLVVNFLTLALVAVGMALAAQLPTAPQPSAVAANGQPAGAGREATPVEAGRG